MIDKAARSCLQSARLWFSAPTTKWTSFDESDCAVLAVAVEHWLYLKVNESLLEKQILKNGQVIQKRRTREDVASLMEQKEWRR